MIDLEKFKSLLGDEVAGLTEEEILILRDNQDQMSEIFLKIWKEKINKK